MSGDDSNFSGRTRCALYGYWVYLPVVAKLHKQRPPPVGIREHDDRKCTYTVLLLLWLLFVRCALCFWCASNCQRHDRSTRRTYFPHCVCVCVFYTDSDDRDLITDWADGQRRDIDVEHKTCQRRILQRYIWTTDKPHIRAHFKNYPYFDCVHISVNARCLFLHAIAIAGPIADVEDG